MLLRKGSHIIASAVDMDKAADGHGVDDTVALLMGADSAIYDFKNFVDAVIIDRHFHSTARLDRYRVVTDYAGAVYFPYRIAGYSRLSQGAGQSVDHVGLDDSGD